MTWWLIISRCVRTPQTSLRFSHTPSQCIPRPPSHQIDAKRLPLSTSARHTRRFWEKVFRGPPHQALEPTTLHATTLRSGSSRSEGCTMWIRGTWLGCGRGVDVVEVCIPARNQLAVPHLTFRSRIRLRTGGVFVYDRMRLFEASSHYMASIIHACMSVEARSRTPLLPYPDVNSVFRRYQSWPPIYRLGALFQSPLLVFSAHYASVVVIASFLFVLSSLLSPLLVPLFQRRTAGETAVSHTQVERTNEARRRIRTGY